MLRVSERGCDGDPAICTLHCICKLTDVFFLLLSFFFWGGGKKIAFTETNQSTDRRGLSKRKKKLRLKRFYVAREALHSLCSVTRYIHPSEFFSLFCYRNEQKTPLQKKAIIWAAFLQQLWGNSRRLANKFDTSVFTPHATTPSVSFPLQGY